MGANFYADSNGVDNGEVQNFHRQRRQRAAQLITLWLYVFNGTVQSMTTINERSRE